MRLIRSICFSLLTMLLLTAPARAETTLDDLLNAADIGSNAVVIDGVRRGMDVDSCDEAGLSLLMRAAREGNLDLVDFLLRNRANLRARTSWGDGAMSLAAQKGHTDVVRRLIQGGGEVNQPGWSAILYAAMEGHVDTVKLLLEKGANPDSRAPQPAHAADDRVAQRPYRYRARSARSQGRPQCEERPRRHRHQVGAGWPEHRHRRSAAGCRREVVRLSRSFAHLPAQSFAHWFKLSETR
ncbi:MAG: ankyrin repeat domain-containing protein [Sterolibacteriaceae bacterium]|uniref:Ankyrin repeat domain-containing protein n=1 Tax=Candidatus Methylophosphatis roskildensis TaxID=2899263 RepID=A0A9D7HUL7_9PROT|nr:ankyrin repeat domain-containing protein [Candidatus Methylophosphatis roskildensis]